MERWGSTRFAARALPDMLRLHGRMIQLAQQPVEAWPQTTPTMFTETNDSSGLIKLFSAGMDKIFMAGARITAQHRCAIVLLAVERYRLAHGRWPRALSELTPTYLSKIPTDPYNSQPLCYRVVEDGVVVYSVGPDGQDDHGNLDQTMKLPPGTDLGFRLWNVPVRRLAKLVEPTEP
jgi:hypothetical protein